jgi:hypothetical protein
MPIRAFHTNLLICRMFAGCLWAVLLAGVYCCGALAEEDPYLSTLSQEAKKVDTANQPTLSETGESAAPAEGGLSIQAFEEDLRAQYMGSYTFYLKLPRRTKEEIFLEYSNGASIDEIRQKIMDRFLHH